MLIETRIDSLRIPNPVAYNGNPHMVDMIHHYDENCIVIEVAVDGADNVQYDIAYGNILHASAPDRGVYVEFFLPGQHGNRDWRPGSFVGLLEENWTVDVNHHSVGLFTVTFSRDS